MKNIVFLIRGFMSGLDLRDSNRRFPLKSTTSGNVLCVFTRATFLLHTCESSFQNVAVAHDFSENSAPYANLLQQLLIKPMQNT